jgi:hypothetical protein
MSVVEPQVPCEMWLLHKCLLAELAGKRPLPRVNPHVIFQQLIPGKGPLANWTAVEALTAVDAEMAGQLLSTGICPLAYLQIRIFTSKNMF